MKKTWGIGAKIWFVFYIFTQWIMFIEYVTKPATAYRSDLQRTTLIFGVVALIGTALILWLAISRKRTALITLLVIAGANALITLGQSGLGSALASLIMPGVNWLITRKGVE